MIKQIKAHTLNNECGMYFFQSWLFDTVSRYKIKKDWDWICSQMTDWIINAEIHYCYALLSKVKNLLADLKWEPWLGIMIELRTSKFVIDSPVVLLSFHDNYIFTLVNICHWKSIEGAIPSKYFPSTRT